MTPFLSLRFPRRSLPTLSLALVLSACGATPPEEDKPAEAPRCAASPVRCAETSIDKLSLLTAPSKGQITEEGTTSGEFLTYVDAAAGGARPTESYVYARFTSQGLSRVDVNDQSALASTDWDIAFRRFLIRVNSGVSGPSCTTVAQLPAGTSFESVTRVDAAWSFQSEDYFTDSCEVVTEQYGLGAGTRLSSFWNYEQCLAMSDDVFVVRLADGKHVKLQVKGYYPLEKQQVCNQTGTVPQPSGAASMRVRWAFLP